MNWMWDDLCWGLDVGLRILTLFLTRTPCFMFVYFWLYWVFVAALRFSLISESRDYSNCSVQAPSCSGFSCGAKALGHTVFSSCGTGGLMSSGCQALGHPGFCIWSTWAQYLGLTGLREWAP